MGKINDIAKKWLTNNYGNLESYETDKYPNYTFFMKDGKVILDYNRKNGRCNISHEEIWSFLESVFRLEYEEIQDITKEWVEEHCKLGVTTTLEFDGTNFLLVEEHCKLGVTTTVTPKIIFYSWWRNIANWGDYNKKKQV